MRRPPGLWILLSAGVVWLSLQDVYGLRATSLIFGKTTTTTTTTEEPEALEEETATTELSGDPNATKPTLTGNPQLDYIWDPNLPKELNGFNLSDYPFYERVPEDIDFKCDGLHDGFYASVQHKCQVYHHCLFGTRYDFLCANYTAFDQKTFICHFASEVDCANSKKFWHRNDALYKSASTTTIKPIIIHTPPPQPSPVTISAIAPLNPSGPDLRRPVGSRRRPFRRRRPQLDYYEDEYYDDYYEERPRSNRGRKRPRPRPRPVYDDEYDEEYDDRYERRGGSRREEKRRPYDRRPSRKRNNERAKYDYDDEVDDRFEDEDFKLNNRRKLTNRKKTLDEESDDRYPERKNQGRRRPSKDRSEENDQKPARKVQRRPPLDDYEDDTYQEDNTRGRRKNEGRRNKPKEETRTIIKPVSGTIYDRPRLAPRIKLPVPKNEADKYAYKPVVTEAASAVQEDEEYYEEYEEDPVSEKNTPRIPALHSRDSKPKNIEESKSSNSRKQISSASQSHPQRPADSYERPKSMENKETHRVPISEEYYDDYEEDEEDKRLDESSMISKSGKREKSASSSSTTTSTTTTTTTTTQRPIEKMQQPLVRLVKRPFLPSRGGNPYVARGLQPVGFKAVEKIPDISPKKEYDSEEVIDDQINAEGDDINSEKQPYLPADAIKSSNDEVKPVFKPSPVIKMPTRVLINAEDFHSEPTHQKNYAGPRTTQKPKIPERNPLDIKEDDYDVTLNDALNPTLPNLPVRGSPVGFNSGNDYTYSNQRPRYGSDPGLSAESSDYVYQTKPFRQTYVPQSNVRDHFVSLDTEFSGQHSTQRENYRPRPVQQETEAFYSRY